MLLTSVLSFIVPGLISSAVYHNQSKNQELSRMSRMISQTTHTWTPDKSVMEARMRFYKIAKDLNCEAVLNDIATTNSGFCYNMSQAVSIKCYNNSPYLVIEENVQEELLMPKDEIRNRIMFGCDDLRGVFININDRGQGKMQLQITVPVSQTNQTESLKSIINNLNDIINSSSRENASEVILQPS